MQKKKLRRGKSKEKIDLRSTRISEPRVEIREANNNNSG